MRFGTLHPLVESAEGTARIGRRVANTGLLRALLRHGSFEGYDLYCPSVGMMGLTKAFIQRQGLSAERLRQVRIGHHAELRGRLATQDYGAFHLGGWGYLTSSAVGLRNAWCASPVPITSVTHSLNHTDSVLDALRLALAQPVPEDVIFCTTHSARVVMKRLFEVVEERFRVRYTGGLEVLPLGIEEELCQPLERLACRRQLGLPLHGQLILVLGRFTPSYKMDLGPVLRQFARFRAGRPATAPPVDLVLAGSTTTGSTAELHTELERLGLTGSVHLVVDFDDVQKAQLYGACELFLSPVDNLQETFGLSLFEAQAAGCVPLVSDYDGYKEVVVDGVTGVRLPTVWADASAPFAGISQLAPPSARQLQLAQCLYVDLEMGFRVAGELLDDEARREAMAAAGRARAARFTWPHVIRRYEETWARLKGAIGARGACPPAAEPPSPFEVPFHRIFAHYPSAMLSDETTLELTELGREALAGAPLPPAYNELGAFLDQSALGSVLEELAREGSQPAAGLYRFFSHVAAARRGLMWLGKHGLLRFDVQASEVPPLD